MTSQRLSLALILVAVAVAGMIAGYVFAGWDDGSSLQTQAPDNAPILNAIATSVAPEPTLPACAEAWVAHDQVCLPVLLTPGRCMETEIFVDRTQAIPCLKP